MAMTFLCLHHSYLDVTQKLTNAEFGQLVRALLRYSADPADRPKVPPKMEMIFSMMAMQVDRERDHYETKAAAARANGRLGGRPRKTDKQNPKTEAENPKTEGDNPNNSYNLIQSNLIQSNLKRLDYKDDDDDISACVREAFTESFNREPTGEELTAISASARTAHLETDLVTELIITAARYGAKTPEAYIRVMISEVQDEYIRTLAEYERSQYLIRAGAGGRKNPEGLTLQELSELRDKEYNERRARYATAADED